MTPDVVLEVPYTVRPEIRRVEGREAVLAVIGQLFTRISPFQLIAVEEHAAPGADWAVVEYRSEGRFVADGAPYANTYVGIYRVRDGRVAHWKEYYNPLAAPPPPAPSTAG